MITILNRVILIGRLTKDPELRYTPASVAVAQFTLAVDRPVKGEGQDADFIPVVTWRQLAETCANYLRKGRLVAVEGRMQVRNYENNEGKRVYVTEVIADNVRFLEGNKASESQGDTNTSSSNSNAYKGNPTPSDRTYAPNVDPFKDAGRPIDIDPDLLPF